MRPIQGAPLLSSRASAFDPMRTLPTSRNSAPALGRFLTPQPCDFSITARPLTWSDQEPREPWIVEGNQRDCSAGESYQPFPRFLRCFLRVWGNIVTDSRGREAMRISLARSVSNRLGDFRRHLARRSRLTHGDRSASEGSAPQWSAAPKGLAQLKLGPASNIVSPRATRLFKAETNCYLTHVSVDAKNHFHIGEEPTEAWIPQRFADQRLLTPFLVCRGYAR